MVDGLTGGEYERLRRAAETYREDLLVRLGGEVGLRPAEMARVRPGDVTTHGDHHLLRVRESEDEDTREAFLPAGVEHDLRKYASAEGVDDDETLFDVTPRRLQMLVRDVGERADLDVSSRDLRHHFARSNLRDGVPPHVVRASGGWDRLASLEPLLDDPDRETVVAAFARGSPPERLRRAVAVAADVGEALAGADSRDAVERAVSERLADTEGYRFAVLATYEGAFARRAAVGVSEERADALLDDRAREAVETREVRVREDGPVPAVVLAPLVHDDRGQGVLVVGVDADLGDLERDLLGVLGTQVGHALAAVEHRRLLVADTVVELEFDSRDDADPVAALSGDLDCRVSLSGMAPAGDDVVCFLAVEDADAAAVLAFADNHAAVRDSRLVEDHGGSALVEVVVTDGPVPVVVEHGGRVTDLSATGGLATLTVDIAPDADVREVVDGVTDRFPGASLTAKREVERSVETTEGFREGLADRLTDRQEAVLRAAYHGGYYEWPRGSTAEELADALDVASPTLHNHLRKAQQKLLTAFFGERA